MNQRAVHIDFGKISDRYRLYVRYKAIEAGSTIVYASKGQIVEEDPKTQKIKILQALSPSK